MKDLYPSRGREEQILKRYCPCVYSDESYGKNSLSKKELNDYEKNGFIALPNVFSNHEVKQMKDELERLKYDEDLRQKEEFITEQDSKELRTVFNQHLFSKVYEKVSKDDRILDKVKQLLGGDVYIHHSRINIKPAYKGKSFPWHSDFETWHCEDGLPKCRCLTAWVMLTDNTEYNGPLYVIPGSHKEYVSCEGYTPDDNYKMSLKKQEYGVPSIDAVKHLTKNSEVKGVYGKAGTLVIHDGNILHGSPDNISPYDRTNSFFVFNSVENTPYKPFGAKTSRADFLCLTDFEPLK
ncbi:MAG: phytanoyl-CoA dioxygenase family protein [Campylobacterota bacterium]